MRGGVGGGRKTRKARGVGKIEVQRGEEREAEETARWVRERVSRGGWGREGWEGWGRKRVKRRERKK